jgi:hypothetical protein
MGEGARRRLLLADGCYLAGGGALVASAFLHWISHGAGSGLRGHALVDALVALGRHVPALSVGRLTVVWYLVPALGALSWIVFGVFGARSRTARVVAVAAVVVAVVADAAFRRLAGNARLGWGSKVALAGGVLVFVGAWAPDIARLLSAVRYRESDERTSSCSPAPMAAATTRSTSDR